MLLISSFFNLADITNKRTAAAYFEATYFASATWTLLFCKNIHALFVFCFGRTCPVYSNDSIVFNPDFKKRFGVIP